MAEVFLARAEGPQGFEKTVVVKRVLPHLASDPQFTGMFLDEARLAAALEHPNIVQIFDLGEVNGQYFIAMEYLRGHALSKILKAMRRQSRSMPYPMVAYVISRVAAALHYAHQLCDPQGKPLNLVHRDVSPDNILLTHSGVVKLIDFGIAKARSNEQVTQSGAIKGKFSYMSPEQIKGKALDGRSDVFALGICLYELATRARPFEGATDMMTFVAITQEPPPPPSTNDPSFPAELESICMKCLEKDRDRRFQSGREVEEALNAYVASTGTGSLDRELADFVSRTMGPAPDGSSGPATAPYSPEDHPKLPTAEIDPREHTAQGVAGSPGGDEPRDTHITLVAAEDPSIPEADATRPVEVAEPAPKRQATASAPARPTEPERPCIPPSDPAPRSILPMILVGVLILAVILGGLGLWWFTRDTGTPADSTDVPAIASGGGIGSSGGMDTGAVVVPPVDPSSPDPGPAPAPDPGPVPATGVPATDVGVLPDAALERQADAGTKPSAPDVPVAVATGTGRLKVVTSAELAVFVDDRRLGSGTQSVELPVGEHVVRVSGGGVNRSVKAAIESGAERIVTVNPVRGQIGFDAPAGTQVSVDGRPVGRTPMGMVQVWEGSHSVEFRDPQGAVARRTVNIGASSAKVIVRMK
jgi:serine/threonine-protein kinase